MNNPDRIDAEWLAVNAFRGVAKIATKGDMLRSTYDQSFELGGELYPELLGEDVSLLRRERESDITKEYRQKSRLRAIRDNTDDNPFQLISEDVKELEELLQIAKKEQNSERVDNLKRRLAILARGKAELDERNHTENQLIFRDAKDVRDDTKALTSGTGYRDFELPESKVLRVRVLHPDKPEHVTGADIIYERHDPETELVCIVAVQYKIWEDRKLYLPDQRMKKQISRLDKFLCQRNICQFKRSKDAYRFPCCSAFLRPTDKLQNPNQRLISRGEHIPICKIDKCKTNGLAGAELLEYEKIKDISLSAETFEMLFNKGCIGSDWLTIDELHELYKDSIPKASEDHVVIYVQELGHNNEQQRTS